MYAAIVFLPILGSIIAGLFGRVIGARASELVTTGLLFVSAALGHILYTDYVYYFQIAGLVLLVAMIGAIVLTLRSRPGVRRQIISVQNARTAAMAVDMHDLKPGEGA